MKTVDEMIEDILRREGGYVNQVRDLQRETAAHIYLSLYFVGAGLDKAPEALQAQLFDINVNGGLAPIRARVGDLEELVREHGGRVANIILAASRVEYYRRVVAHRPTQDVFLKGWINRAMEFAEWE